MVTKSLNCLRRFKIGINVKNNLTCCANVTESPAMLGVMLFLIITANNDAKNTDVAPILYSDKASHLQYMKTL